MQNFLHNTRALYFDCFALLGACVTYFFNWLGVKYFYFDTVLHWDTATHFLGGLTASLWAAAVCARFHVPPRRAFVYMLLFILCIGIGWEIFEIHTGLEVYDARYWPDTIKDVVADTSGMFLVWAIYAHAYTKNSH